MLPRVAWLLLPAVLLACDDGAEGPADGATPGADAAAGDLGAADLGAADLGVSDSGAPDAGSTSCPEIGTALGDGIAPDRRDDMATAYDPDCGRVFAFFGDQGVPMVCSFAGADFASDVFMYDVSREAWYQITPENTGPNPTDRAGAIWDELRERVVIFGGRWRPGSSGAYQYPRDVWAYHVPTNRWERILTAGPSGPTGRMDFVMVADPREDRFIVSHGGQFTPRFTSFNVFGDTWAFDLQSNTWEELAADQSPPGRVYPSGAVDATRRQLWVFSGSGEDAFVAPARLEMRVLDLASEQWTELSPDAASWPEGRFNAPMIWDEMRDRLVLFGGHDNSRLGNDNDLWAFDLETQTWRELREGDTFNKPALGQCDFPGDFTNADLDSPERRAAHLFVRTGPDLAITYGGNTDCGLANDTWALDLATDTWTQITASPSGLTCPRTGNPNCSDPSARMCD